MTLRAFLHLLRRWIVVIIVGTLVAAGAAVAAFLNTQSSYEVSSRYLFLAAAIDAEGEPVNPFLQIGNGIGVLIDVVSASMLDGQTVREFAGDGETLEYTVGQDTGLSAPVMLIMVTAHDPDEAFDVLERLGEEALTRARSIQIDAGAPRTALIAGTELTRSIKAEVDHIDGIRNGVLAGLGVLVLVLVAVVLGDRRRSRTKQRAGQEADAQLPADEDGSAGQQVE